MYQNQPYCTGIGRTGIHSRDPLTQELKAQGYMAEIPYHRNKSLVPSNKFSRAFRFSGTFRFSGILFF
jgi:hypothetical protein